MSNLRQQLILRHEMLNILSPVEVHGLIDRNARAIHFGEHLSATLSRIPYGRPGGSYADFRPYNDRDWDIRTQALWRGWAFFENRSVRRRVAWIGFGMQRRCA